MQEVIRQDLLSIIDRIEGINETLQGIGFYDFINDRKKKIFVTDSLMTISELFLNLSNNDTSIKGYLESITPENMFKVIFHKDFGVADELIWKLSKVDLQVIEKNIRKILK